MKILYLVDPLPNYVSDPLYLGLVRILGSDAVIDFPSKAVLHDPQAKIWYLPQMAGRARSHEEVRTLLADRLIDLVCVASPRPESLRTLADLFDPKGFPPIAFIDSADERDIRHDVAARFPLAVYFKREYVWKEIGRGLQFIRYAKSFRFDRKLFAKTFPLQISVVLDEIPRTDVSSKDIDVSFYGHVSDIKRVKALHVLRAMEREGINVAAGIYAAPTDRKYKLHATPLRRLIAKLRDPSCVSDADVKRRLTPSDYYNTIARSKMAISIRGGGFDTYRYWEIVACRRLLLSEQPDIVIPHDFEHRKHAVFFRADLKDLPELVRYYRDHDEEREAIAAEGYAHLLKHHTCERRAEYFLEICSRTI